MTSNFRKSESNLSVTNHGAVNAVERTRQNNARHRDRDLCV